MQREKIREQLSVLEERLEQLEGFFSSAVNHSPEQSGQYHSAKSSFHDLQSLVRDEALRQRSISTEDFVRKILPFLIKETNAKGFDIHIGYYAEGKISMEMVEISMNAILSCIRASLKCYQGMTRTYRMQKKLFLPYSFFLDVRADVNEIRFALVDDGLGYKGNFKAEFDSEKHFRTMRSHLALHDGWFGNESFAGNGGRIQFRIPQQRSRFDCLLLDGEGCQILLPASCVVETLDNADMKSIITNPNIRYCFIEEKNGLVLSEKAAHAGENFTAVKVGVADFQFWIFCKKIRETVKARRLSGKDFLESEAWFRDFGVFLREGAEVLMPLADGSVLMDFYQKHGVKHEGL